MMKKTFVLLFFHPFGSMHAINIEAKTTTARFFRDGQNHHGKYQIPSGLMFCDGNRQGSAVRDQLSGKVTFS